MELTIALPGWFLYAVAAALIVHMGLMLVSIYVSLLELRLRKSEPFRLFIRDEGPWSSVSADEEADHE